MSSPDAEAANKRSFREGDVDANGQSVAPPTYVVATQDGVRKAEGKLSFAACLARHQLRLIFTSSTSQQTHLGQKVNFHSILWYAQIPLTLRTQIC